MLPDPSTAAKTVLVAVQFYRDLTRTSTLLTSFIFKKLVVGIWMDKSFKYRAIPQREAQGCTQNKSVN